MQTIKQKWASERNFNYGSICGIITRVRHLTMAKSTTSSEASKLSYVAGILTVVRDNWPANNSISREKYLKAHKCEK